MISKPINLYLFGQTLDEEGLSGDKVTYQSLAMSVSPTCKILISS